MMGSVLERTALRRFAGLLVIISSLIVIYLLAQSTGLFGIYYTEVALPLLVIYFVALLSGLLILLPSSHRVGGVILVIESILVFLSLTSSYINIATKLLLPLPLFIGGLLALLYRYKEPKIFPKTAKRLTTVGAYLLLLAMFLDIVEKGIVLNTLSQAASSISFAIPPPLWITIFTLIAYVPTAIVIFILILYSCARLRSSDLKQITKASENIIELGVFAIILAIVVSFIFSSLGFSIVAPNISVLSGVTSSLSTGSQLSAEVLDLLVLFLNTLFIIGLVFVILGGISGLAYSKKQGLAEYILANKKFVLYPIIAVLIIYILWYYYTVNQTATDNKLALASLDSKIQAYGGNLRYMLANETAYDAAMAGPNTILLNYKLSHQDPVYKSLVAMSTPQPNLTSIMDFGAPVSESDLLTTTVFPQVGFQQAQQQPYTIPSSQEINSYDWYVYNPLIRNVELYAIFSLGIFDVGGNIQTAQQPSVDQIETELRIPKQVSPLQSSYELQSYGLDILYIAEAMVSIFSNYSVFNSPIANMSNVTPNSLGYGISALSGGTPSTTLLNGNIYDVLSASQLSNGWLELIFPVSSIGGKGFPRINNSTQIDRFFYLASLTEYTTYYTAEVFYNQTIAPNIDFFGYLNDTSIINLGNLNLTSPEIAIYIDGQRVNYTRHYNYIVVYNTHLNVGYHYLIASVNNLNLSATVYVSPTSLSNVGISSLSANTTLFFSITNPYVPSLNVTNVSVIGGVTQPPTITPSNISTLYYNWSSSYTETPTLENATYSKFMFSKTEYNNYTMKTFTVANYSTYSIPTSNYSIHKNDYATLEYSIPKCPLSTTRYYTVTFNTNYGKGRYILATRCN